MKLLTLNINFYGNKHGSWDKRKALIVEQITRQDPDVVALQAVRQINGHSQADEIAAALTPKYDAFFHGRQESTAGTDGQAFLTRLPVTAQDVRPLSHHPANNEDDYHRFVYRLSVDDKGTVWDIYNCHFSWVEPQNEDNVRETLAFIHRSDRPGLIAGDFNASPESRSIKALEDDAWTDVWKYAGTSGDGATFESPEPEIRIDYIWANPAASKKVSAVEIIRQENRSENIRLSDHLGLAGSFRS